jgi:hypothetical protein
MSGKYPLSEAYVQKRLVLDRVCRRCGRYVLTSELDEYKYQCVHCDEDLYEFETVQTEDSITRAELDELIEDVYYEIFNSEEEYWQ